MKNPFQTGDLKVYETTVTEAKLASFDGVLVHRVYSTFALAKDVEWACRLFVLEMKETGEEGVGSFLSVNHLFPAPLSSKVRIEAKIREVIGNKIVCTYQAFANEHLIAEGEQTQRIIQKERFAKVLEDIKVSTEK